MTAELEHLLKLGRAERIQLVEDLWDSIAEESTLLPISDGKAEELRRRKTAFKNDPDSGLSWEQVKKEARSRRA